MTGDQPWLAQARPCQEVLERSIPRHLLGQTQIPDDDGGNILHFLEKHSLLTPLELEMTSQNVESLLQKYRQGTWRVEDVIVAFLKRAVIGQKLLNFATEFLADPALQLARHLDETFSRTGALVGPLHGVPISIKEHISIKGTICTSAFVCNAGNIAEEDAHIVRLLKEAGAVILFRTNQPQAIMHLDCSNNITGTTFNPFDRRLSPGGSSGGEGAALAFRCSMIGVGTDIGGSIRCPAAFCGTYGFKPTSLRLPGGGLQGIFGGQESVLGCVGPLTNSLEDAVYFQKVMLDRKPWDTEPSLLPVPWRDVGPPPPTLTIGIMFDDSIIKPHPPITRALLAAEQRLSSAGVKCVRWSPHRHDEGVGIVRRFYVADGGVRMRRLLEASGEPTHPLTEHVLSFSNGKGLSVVENWELNEKRDAIRTEYLALMQARGVDVILCPTYVGVGTLQGQAKCWSYTAMWNFLDYPAVVFPSGLRVDKEVDVFDTSYSPRSSDDEREWKAYDADLFDGVPIALQLVGKRFHDEELLKAARIVEEALGKRSDRT
ncbi:hypothetical protein HIM_01344 [Hirsutella minnesotensis 3608]|nr:hypothetical protein HIM_01344 [Hirsutella minnesotensis 3608]